MANGSRKWRAAGDMLHQVALMSESALKEKALRGELEAVRAQDGGVTYREPLLFVPRRAGTWTEDSWRAYDAKKAWEPVEIPGREGVWRVVDVFMGAKWPLEWDGTQWVESAEGKRRVAVGDGSVRYVAVRVEPWTQEVAPVPRPLLAATPVARRLVAHVAVPKHLVDSMPNLADEMRTKIQAAIDADAKRDLTDAIARSCAVQDDAAAFLMRPLPSPDPMPFAWTFLSH